MVIVTRAGHGGRDLGASNPYNPLRPEKVINLEIDEAFERVAVLNGHTVYRQRIDDSWIDLSGLDTFARAHGAEVIIEFHCNWVLDRSQEGVLYIAVPSTPGDALGHLITSEISWRTGMSNRGILPQYWERLRRDIPHIISENGFISNATDEQLLAQPEVIERIAFSHLVGIHRYYNLHAPIEKPGVGAPLALALLPIIVVGVALYLLAPGELFQPHTLASAAIKTGAPSPGEAT